MKTTPDITKEDLELAELYARLDGQSTIRRHLFKGQALLAYDRRQREIEDHVKSMGVSDNFGAGGLGLRDLK